MGHRGENRKVIDGHVNFVRFVGVVVRLTFIDNIFLIKAIGGKQWYS